jgi:OCT family organic cation transporter-like MFS transporter 4/5
MIIGEGELTEKLMPKGKIDHSRENETIRTKRNFNLNDAVKSAGDYGWYQIFNLIYLSFVWIIIPSIPIMLPYFRMMPKFICQSMVPATNTTNSTIMTHECTIQEVCDNTITKISADNPLKTWATDFNLFCEKSIYFGFIGSVYFLGILFGSFFLPKFTDKFGRKPVLIFILLAYLVTSAVTLIAWSYAVLFFISFIIGVLFSGTSICAFVLNFESSSSERKLELSTILMMSYSIGAIIHILIFFYFQNWIITVLITSIICIILLILSFHIQESLQFLYSKGRYGEMEKVLEYIAKINSRSEKLKTYLASTDMEYLIKESNDRIIERENDKKDETTLYGIAEILPLKSYRSKLIIMSINWFVMTLTFYGINFNVTNFGTNPYFTGILIYASESIAQLCALYFITVYGCQKTLIGSYLLSFLGLVTMSVISHRSSWYLVFLFLSKFGISATTSTNYTYTADIFPIMVRMAAMSFCSLMSRIGGMAGTMIIELTHYAMMGFGLLCLITALLLLLIKTDRSGN